MIPTNKDVTGRKIQVGDTLKLTCIFYTGDEPDEQGCYSSDSETECLTVEVKQDNNRAVYINTATGEKISWTELFEANDRVIIETLRVAESVNP